MFIWTDEKIQCVKDLWGKQSASEIAGIIGHPSRSAVCGKAHRLGLAKLSQPRIFRPQKPRPRVQRFREVQPPADFYDRPTTKEELEAELKAADACTIMDLTRETCRWPLWSDANPERLYCGADGADMENKRPYCPVHSQMAYQPRRAA